MRKTIHWPTIFIVCLSSTVLAQIDPEKRQLLQFGYSQPFEGQSPIDGYGYYYRNEPGFLRTNITLRLAIAPVYLDSEVAFAHALGEQTDLAVGLAGGGFADSYAEIQSGNFLEAQSFVGHSAEMSASIYHRFNPGSRIPLTGVLKTTAHQSFYVKNSDTSDAFDLPPNRTTFKIRAGVRFGGKEPLLNPDVAMELSAWYEGQFRSAYGDYGYDDDRSVNPASHLFWGRALLVYTLPECKHNFGISLNAGTSVDADRFSAYRPGGVFLLISEFPLSLPGYYSREISARNFAMVSGHYSIPLDEAGRWNVMSIGSAAVVDYVPGLEQPGNFHSGAGLGIGYKSKKNGWEMVAGYSYGFNAIRNDGRGAQSVGLIFQFDFEARRAARMDPDSPDKGGLFRLMR